MKNFLSSMKISHFITLFIAAIIFININYYNYIYKGAKKDIILKKIKLTKTIKNINKNILKLNQDKTLLKKIKFLENKVMENKYEIGYLKNKNKTRKDIINIIKNIISESNISLANIKLLSEKTNKETGNILFELSGKATIRDFIYLLDNIDNKQDFISIKSYKLKILNSENESNIYNIKMILSFVYILS